MAELKTKRNTKSVTKFLNSVIDENKKADSFALLKLMQQTTKEEPKMWGDSIVGFGEYHYVYESGREGDFFLAGFSPRKQYLAVYVMSGFKELANLLKKLGKFKKSVSCLYLKSLSDVDQKVLKEIIKKSVSATKKKYR
ncbi:MAG TPA: DUF1801 domain-containing protein [Ignavibacteriaceae bacterium]|nr:DUF1801 domain-containing protein [Ignavibacteriaceae bacterium]